MNVKKLVTCFILMMVIIVGMNIFIIKKMFPAEDDSYIVELNRVEQLINEYEMKYNAAAENLSTLSSVDESVAFSYILRIESKDSKSIDNSLNEDLDFSNGEKCIYYFTDDYIYKIVYIERTINVRRDNIKKMIIMVDLLIIFTGIIMAGIILLIDRKYVMPFRRIEDLPVEIAKGNLTKPLKIHTDKSLGKFNWGMNMLREKYEKTKAENLRNERDKKVLLMSLSHDIKTPLNAISLYAKAISKGVYKEDKVISSADAIGEKVSEIEGYMKRIVAASNEDIIEFEVENTEIYLKDLFHEIDDYYHDKMKLEGIDFNIGNYKNTLIRGDKDRLVEVFQNVIENAIKYGDKNKIDIAVSEEEYSVEVAIRNTGCMLKKSEIGNIFESFYRGTNTGTREGSGLGLYICRKLMHKMDGEIYAEIVDSSGDKSDGAIGRIDGLNRRADGAGERIDESNERADESLGRADGSVGKDEVSKDMCIRIELLKC